MVAVTAHQQGDIEQAQAMYEEILSIEPEQPDALHFLGVLQHQLGYSDKAVELIHRALAAAGPNPGMQLNLGNICRESGRLEEAEAAYRAALELAPEYADAWSNLGALVRRKGELKEAERHFRKALSLNPDHAEAHHYLGYMAHDAGEWDSAVRHYKRAYELFAKTPGEANAALNLASVMIKSGRRDDAERVLAEWRVREPDNPTAEHMLAAVTGENVPERASAQYVKALFDSFAPSFDEVLGDLHYRAPRVVAECVAALGGEPFARVLDAGCGTGLSGAALREHATYLCGVDLSPVMLNRARARGVYDDTVEADLIDYLGDLAEPYDVIASVDTLNYFGALEAVLTAARTALRPGGWLCFTLEKTATSDGRGYELGTSGRYAHQTHYVDQCLEGAGFVDMSREDAVLRLESGQPVAGSLYLVRSPG